MQRRDDDGVEAAAIAALVPLEGKRVLEVGCGKGRLTTLAASSSSVYAFDPSAENVAASRAALTSEHLGVELGARVRGPLDDPVLDCDLELLDDARFRARGCLEADYLLLG
jgi:SAM-dependent methyltransferase